MKSWLSFVAVLVVFTSGGSAQIVGESAEEPEISAETAVLLEEAQQELEELYQQITHEEERLSRVQAQLAIYRRQQAMMASAESAFQLGEELYMAGSIVWARDAFEAVIYNFPESAYYNDALFRLELIAFELQDYQTALDYFDRLRQNAPGFAFMDLAIIAAGLSTYNQGDFSGARNLYRQVAPSGDYGALAEYLTAVAFVEDGDRISALATLEGILARGSISSGEVSLTDRARIALAQIQVEEGLYETALGHYSRVSPFSSYYDVAMLGKTWTLMRLGEYQEAYNLSERVLEEVPTSELRSEFELAMANCALGAEDLDMAIGMYQELLVEHQESDDFYDLFLSGSSMSADEYEAERERLNGIRLGLVELKEEAYQQGDLELVAAIEEEEAEVRQLLLEIGNLETMQSLPSDMDTETLTRELTRLIQQSRANTEILVIATDEIRELSEERGTLQDREDLADIEQEVDRIRLALQNLASQFDGGMTREFDWVLETQYGIAVATFMDRELKRDSVDFLGAYYRNRIQEAYEEGDSTLAVSLESQRSGEISSLNQRIDAGALVAAGYFQDFLASYPESRFTPDVLVRLAQLYYDIDNLQHSQQQAAAGTEQFIMEDYTRSIELYQRVITDHPDSELQDVALYSMGYCLEAMMDFEAAVERYRDVLEDHPESDLAAECNIRVGNYYFDILEYDTARIYFQNILRYPGASANLYQHGLYKLGWTLYLSKDFRQSVAVFAFLLKDDMMITELGISRRGDIRILDEAREYMAYDFLEMTDSSLPPVGAAVAFLREFDDSVTTIGVLSQMAEISAELTDWETAIDAYVALLQFDPYTDDAPLYQANVALAYEELGDYASAAVARDLLVSSYGVDSDWFAHVGDESALALADSLRGSSFEEAIQYYLEQTVTAQGDPVVYNAANEALVERIGTYLEQYGSSPMAYDYRFHLGDAHYHLGHYVDAGDVYFDVAMDSSSFQRQEVALSNSFSSYLTAYDEVPGVDSLAIRQRLMETAQYYASAYPDGENVAWFFWAAAPKFFNAGEYQPARELFNTLYYDYPNSGYTARAAKFIADSYQFEEMYSEAEQWYGLAASTAARTGEDLGADIEMLAASSAYNDAASLAESESTEDLLAAALRWEQTAHEHPGSEVAPVALYDAADTYGRAGDIASAVRLFNELALTYPQYENAPSGLLRGAYLLREDGQFVRAAEMYIAAYDRFPNAPDMTAALSSAASSFEEGGRDDLAMGVYARIANGGIGTAAVICRAYAKIGEYNYGIGNISVARSNFDNCMSVYDQYRDGPAEWPAMSAYHVGRISSNDYYAIQPVTADNVQYKTQLFNETVANYNRTFTYLDDEYVFLAVLDIGILQEDFANSIGFMEAPEGLTPEGEEAFYNTLLEAYDTYIGRAITTYENGLELAMDNGIENDITDQIAEKLDLLLPGTSSAMGYGAAGATPVIDETLPDETAPDTQEETTAAGDVGTGSTDTFFDTPVEDEDEGGGCFLWPF